MNVLKNTAEITTYWLIYFGYMAVCFVWFWYWGQFFLWLRHCTMGYGCHL